MQGSWGLNGSRGRREQRTSSTSSYTYLPLRKRGAGVEVELEVWLPIYTMHPKPSVEMYFLAAKTLRCTRHVAPPGVKKAPLNI